MITLLQGGYNSLISVSLLGFSTLYSVLIKGYTKCTVLITIALLWGCYLMACMLWSIDRTQILMHSDANYWVIIIVTDLLSVWLACYNGCIAIAARFRGTVE